MLGATGLKKAGRTLRPLFHSRHDRMISVSRMGTSRFYRQDGGLQLRRHTFVHVARQPLPLLFLAYRPAQLEIRARVAKQRDHQIDETVVTEDGMPSNNKALIVRLERNRH